MEEGSKMGPEIEVTLLSSTTFPSNPVLRLHKVLRKLFSKAL